MSRLAAVLVVVLSACGRLGYEAVTDTPVESRDPDAGSEPTPLSGHPTCSTNAVTMLRAGWDHTCSIIAGELYCWGNDDHLQLGEGRYYTSHAFGPLLIDDVTGSVRDVATGTTHSCGLTDAGVECWGSNGYGQVGDGTEVDARKPISVVVPGTPVAIDAGRVHSCALTDAGEVYCWGADDREQSGGAASDTCSSSSSPLPCHRTPHRIAGIPNAVDQLVVGDHHGCVLAAGQVFCWGINEHGELGHGGPEASSAMPAVAALPEPADDVQAGAFHTCARGESGTLYCWGANFYGLLGDGTSEERDTPVAVPLPGPVGAFSLGFEHTCAASEGQLYCWGRNDTGQVDASDQNLCAGGERCRTAPWPVPGVLGTIDAVAAGRNHTCAVVDQALYCWGSDETGQLGIGYQRVEEHPVEALVGPIFHAVARGEHTCVIMGGEVSCVGNNDEYQVGRDDVSYSTSWNPVPLLGGGVPTSLIAGDDHTCALIDGGLQCWGDNANGRLGRGFAGPDQVAADWAVVPGTVRSAATNGATACAVVDEGAGPQAYCWGYGQNGALGDGGFDSSYTPVQPLGISGPGLTVMSGAEQRNCAVVDGAVYCWGINYGGRLGVGIGASASDTCKGEPCITTPTQVVGLDSSSAVTMLAVGSGHFCAANADNLWCWGENRHGQVNPDDSGNYTEPFAIASVPTPIEQLVAGRNHTCALVGGDVYCWGDDSYAQLGSGAAVNGGRHPTRVAGLATVIEIVVGDAHTCAVEDRDNDGRGDGLMCWGWNSRAQLGNGTMATNQFGAPPCGPAPVQDP